MPRAATSEVPRVRKADGSLQPFDESKLRRSLRRTGAPEAIVNQVVQHVRNRLTDGMTTHTLYQTAFDSLNARRRGLSGRYSLKRSVMMLGPPGYAFERLIAAVLRANGCDTEVDQIFEGRLVRHEVDVVGKRDGRVIMVECKHHHAPGLRTDVKVAMYVYARSLDLREGIGARAFDEFWLVTNTRFTGDALRYGNGVGLHMVDWANPPERSLASLVDDAGLHPITCLSTLTRSQKRRLLDQGVLLCRTLADPHVLEPLRLEAKRLHEVQSEARFVSGDPRPRGRSRNS